MNRVDTRTTIRKQDIEICELKLEVAQLRCELDLANSCKNNDLLPYVEVLEAEIKAISDGTELQKMLECMDGVEVWQAKCYKLEREIEAANIRMKHDNGLQDKVFRLQNLLGDAYDKEKEKGDLIQHNIDAFNRDKK